MIEYVKQIIDYAEPQMDVYEFALYMYLVRHTRLVEKLDSVFGFKSIRKTMVIGVGVKNTPMSEGICYEKLKSLQSKGFIKIIDSTSKGQRVSVFFPDEILGLIPKEKEVASVSLEEIDFFSESFYRAKIFDRENGQCFYCARQLTSSNSVLEHVISRPAGNNSYKNLVAACRSCNNKKSDLSAKDFARQLLRNELISDDEFEQLLNKIIKLQQGELVPKI